MIGAVARSRADSSAMASCRLVPHMSGPGFSVPQNEGRSGVPNNRQRNPSSSWTHGTPAGLPCGMPGIGEVIEGAVQQSAQPGRQEKTVSTMARSVAGQGWRSRLKSRGMGKAHGQRDTRVPPHRSGRGHRAAMGTTPVVSG
ncbi:MAG: hypothetical protein C0521_04175 [Xanthomonas sp.]|nr:hypothetical protein [Xanthomonas sp.]